MLKEITDYNTGGGNLGNYNVGDYNEGNGNTGYYNIGSLNVGVLNAGDCNTGDNNIGSHNTGHFNIGLSNTGCYNLGNHNTGDWNLSDCNTGCFNTKLTTIQFFNKPSNWTYLDWIDSEACELLSTMPSNIITPIHYKVMTDEERESCPKAKLINNFLRRINPLDKRQKWWNNLSDEEQQIIKSIPNFDAGIFKEITGIDVSL